MRFPRKGTGIDEERAKRQILMAVEQGVNYFDTAYIYPGSEKVLGKALLGGVREKVKIADKMPHMLVKTRRDMDSIFTKQLERLATDYIDYYLVHNIGSWADWQRILELGLLEFIGELRKQGKIRYFGFSFHGNSQTFCKLIDAHPWDFCQIQYNYLDENFQAGRQGLEYAARAGVGIIAMEPLRGGILGEKIPPKAEKILREKNQDRTPAEWALRWLLSHPQIAVVLSGMGREEHIEENIRIAKADDSFELSPDETLAIAGVKEFFSEKIKVGCTGCAYCLPCPYKVDIPSCFAAYDDYAVHGGLSPLFHYLMSTGGIANGSPTQASRCKNCGICLKRCPQQIPIPEKLRETAKAMEKAYLRIPAKLAFKLMRLGRR